MGFKRGNGRFKRRLKPRIVKVRKLEAAGGYNPRGAGRASIQEDPKEKKPLVKGETPAGDTLAAMKAYGLPECFPPKVLAAAEEALKAASKPGKRLDLRRKFIFTCDPQSARDYDDALSLETDKQGRRVLGVHIADVGHFVKAGGALDKEAYRRGTSVYLADRVIPMLPESLSNGVCSLVPGEDRLAFSVFMTFDDGGRMVKRSFAKTVIRSKARFTYEEVMAVLAGRKSASKSGMKAAWRSKVRAIGALAQTLRAARFAAGALDISVPELEVILDDEKRLKGLKVRADDESHQMIEECMVAANEAVATELWTRGIRILTRLHEPPDKERLDELRAGAMQLGIKCGELSNPRQMRRFLDAIKRHPLAGQLALMVLRSQKRAVYDAKKMGHWGLAKRFYAHFTSPIRRYPDLTLHRQLASLLAGYGGREDDVFLERAAKHLTDREANAAEAERNVIEVKKYRYLEENPGPWDAVISKVTRFGVFIDIPELAAGGMVHVSSLSANGEYVRWNQFDSTLSDSHETWSFGMKMKVHLAGADYERRRLEFIPSRGAEER